MLDRHEALEGREHALSEEPRLTRTNQPQLVSAQEAALVALVCHPQSGIANEAEEVRGRPPSRGASPGSPPRNQGARTACDGASQCALSVAAAAEVATKV